MIKIVELASVTPQPWRNGGGQTRELLAWPARNDWQLRVSVADIDRDGPFSPFPGVARCFAVLEGAGVVLSLPAREHTLTAASMPLAFDGADAPGCRLVDGPTRDLNLMALHAAGQAGMAPVAEGVPCPTGGRWIGVYTTTPARLDTGEGSLTLPPASLAWADSPVAPWHLRAAGPGSLRAWWLTLDTRKTEPT